MKLLFKDYDLILYIFLTQIYFCIPEIFKTNNLLKLCSRVVNSQKLFCSQKARVKCSYQSFLVYVQENFVDDFNKCT